MNNYYYTIQPSMEEKAEGSGHGIATAAAVVAALTTLRTGKIKEYILFVLAKYYNLYSIGISVKTYARNTTGNTRYTDARIQKHIPAAQEERPTGKLQVHKVNPWSPREQIIIHSADNNNNIEFMP